MSKRQRHLKQRLDELFSTAEESETATNLNSFNESQVALKEGGKATFLLPSKLAYGTQGQYPIAGYTALLYDVQLVKVVQVSKK